MNELPDCRDPRIPALATETPGSARAADSSADQDALTSDDTREPPGGPPAVRVPFGTTATSQSAFGRYEVRRSLGAGGFGEVYLGHDTQLHRSVAIKVLHAGFAPLLTEADALQEARKLAHLRHPGIVAVHDIGVHAGQMYVVTDFVDGPNLHHWLRDNHPSWPEAARIIAAIADALSHAHARRIVHRDIKPSNIILTADRAPVLVDFGLALGEEQAGARGRVSGTPWYMSPEQAQGTAHRIDGRTDVYSLGVVLYELLTGRVPFDAATIPELLRQVCDDEPQPPRQLVRDIPPELERVCLKALAKSQQDRYTTAADFAEDLRHVLLTAAGSPALGSTPVEVPAGAQATPGPTSTPARTGGVTPAGRPSSRDAERRHLTVLVAGSDVFESDAYLQLDSEDQARVLQVFQDRCDEAIRQFGGTVVQFTDKGLLACFGFPVAYEDAAARAARAGLAIVDTSKLPRVPIGRHDTLTLDPWVGIHTGAAVVESKADTVSLVGEARNVAVRLEDAAVAGQVICTDASQRLFRGEVPCVSLGRQTIKIATHPVELFRIEPMALTGSPMDAVAPAELSPLTGRDREMGLLMDRWEQAREGMGQVVLLIGEPGLGKSRLVHTMKQHVLGQMVEGEVDAPVIEWRCSPRFRHTKLYPAIDFYERALRFRPEEPAEDRFDRMLHRLEHYDLAQPDTVPLWASLLSLPTPDRYPRLSLSPVRLREETFRAMLEWLHTRAARTPILFIVEDLHWVDASTLEFLGQFLAEGLHDSILTLLTFRPEFKTPWPAVAHQTSLALNRLTRRQVGELMMKKVKRVLPEAIVQQVFDRAGGVPLFVEEFTRMVQESGVADQDGARGQALPGHAIPATLQDLMMTRLDRMEGERDVAQLASVLGREFTYEVLAAVIAADEPTLQMELAKLVQEEILYPKGRPPRCRYSFKHALLEDALYSTLVKAKRQQFHRRIAEVLEAQFPQTTETQPELIAHHFSEAGLAEKGVGYWLKAGLRSRERWADVEAIGHLTKGLALVRTFAESPERDAQELQFLNPLGTTYLLTYGYAAPEVGLVFRRARDLCERIEQPTQLFAIMWGTWAWHMTRGDLKLCMNLAAEAMDFAAHLNDPGIQMEAIGVLGATLFYRGDFAHARDAFDRAAQYEDRARTKFWAAYTGHDAAVTRRANLSMIWWHLGYPNRALQFSREMTELAQAIGQPFIVANALYHRLVLNQFCRLAADIEADANEQIRSAAEQGFNLFQATGLLHKAGGLLLQGRWQESLPLLGQGLAAYRGTGAVFFLPNYLSILGDAYTQAGQFTKAHESLDEGLALADRNDERSQEAELHRLQGELRLAETNDEAAAEECFYTAIERARCQQSKAWELRATTSLARLWQRRGRSDEARDALAAVYGTYTEGFTTPDLVDAKVLLESLAKPARTTS